MAESLSYITINISIIKINRIFWYQNISNIMDN